MADVDGDFLAPAGLHFVNIGDRDADGGQDQDRKLFEVAHAAVRRSTHLPAGFFRSVASKKRSVRCQLSSVALKSGRLPRSYECPAESYIRNSWGALASASTDLNGAAAVIACQQIMSRLRDFAAVHLADEESGLVASPEHVIFEDGHIYDSRKPRVRITFAQLCNDARRERVDLGARGFFATPGIDFNRETGREVYIHLLERK